MNKMTTKRRVAALAAGAVGASLALGGTYALWSDSFDLAPGGNPLEIVNGNLDIAAPSDAATAFGFWDVSADRSDRDTTAGVTGTQAHLLDGEDVGLTPGDTFQINIPFAVAMKGENMVAEAVADLGALSEVAEGVDMTIQLYTRDWMSTTWNAVGSSIALTDANIGAPISFGYFQPKSDVNPVDAGAIPQIDRRANNAFDGDNANFVAVLTMSMDVDEDRPGVMLSPTVFEQLRVDLNQVRTSGVGNFS